MTDEERKILNEKVIELGEKVVRYNELKKEFSSLEKNIEIMREEIRMWLKKDNELEYFENKKKEGYGRFILDDKGNVTGVQIAKDL